MDRKATASDRKSNNTKRKRGQRHWTPEQRQLFRAWHNYYPTLAYARNDPKTIYVAVDHAARMAGMNRCGFYNRYLLSGRLPYVVRSWWHAGKRRRKSLVLRTALLEMLTEKSAARRSCSTCAASAPRWPLWNASSSSGARPKRATGAVRREPTI